MSEVRSFGLPDDDETTESQYSHSTNVLDDLRKSLAQKASVENLELKVPSRPNITMVFEPDIEFDLLRSFLKRASNNKKNEFNPMVLAFQVISKTNVGVKVNGRDAHDEEQTPLSVTHRQFRDMLGAHDVTDAIRKLYENDGHIMSAAQRIVEAAGYSDVDMEDEGSFDPLGN